MAQQYQAETVSLLWPIQDDKGNTLSHISLQMITHNEQVKILADSQGDDEIAFIKFAHSACGLSHSEVKRLKMPDWNTLRQKLAELVTQGSDYFFKRQNIAFDTDNPPLLVAIQGDDDQFIEHITLQIPSVETTALMQKQTTLEDKSLFITMACTQLSKSEIQRLSAPDWNYLQGRIGSFLNETADFFR